VDLSIGNIDKLPVEAIVSYSTTDPTNHDVTVTIETNKRVNTPTGWTRVDDTHFQRSYATNTSENVLLIDEAGNSSSVIINITNIDKTPPDITIFGDNPMTILRGETYYDWGAVANDNVDGTVDVIVESNVNTNVAGTYYVIYTATDAAGNTTVATRTIFVKDVIYSAILLPDVYLIGEEMGQLIVTREDIDGTIINITNFTHNFDSSTTGDKVLEIKVDGQLITTVDYTIVSIIDGAGFLRIFRRDTDEYLLVVEYYSHAASFNVVYYFSPTPLRNPLVETRNMTPTVIELTNTFPGMQANKNRWTEINITNWPRGFYYFSATEAPSKNDDFKMLPIF